MKFRQSVPFLIFASALLTGCGGDGGGGEAASTTAFPTLSIDWGARTRLITAPSSALSAKIIIRNAKEGNGDFVWVINREDSLAAFKRTYTSSTRALTGDWTVKVELFGERDGGGAIVGEGVANVKLASNGQFQDSTGKPIPGISTVGKITSAYIGTGYTVYENALIPLEAVAANELNQIVPVTPGSIRFTQVSGAGKVSVSADGIATGITPGTATVTATIDGKTSTTGTVTCIPRPSDYIRTLNFKAGDAVSDPAGESILVSETDKNRVVRINLETGAITVVRTLPFSPRSLALTADGAFLYVGSGSSAVVAKIQLSNNQVVSQFTFSTQGGITCGPMKVSPANGNLVAVTPKTAFSPSTDQVQLFNNGTALPDRLFGDCTSMVFSADGKYLYRYSGESTGFGLARATVTATGLTQDVSKSSVFSSFGVYITLVNGQLFGSTGQYFDGNTLNVSRSLSTPLGSSRNFLVDTAADRYLSLSSSGDNIYLQRLSDGATLLNLSGTGMSAGVGIPVGSKRFVTWGGDNLYIIKPLPEVLP